MTSIERLHTFQRVLYFLPDIVMPCRYPTIVWAPCVAHQMDLLLEDIGKMAFAADLVKRAHESVKFLTNHQASLAIFREHSKKELLRPGQHLTSRLCMPWNDFQAEHVFQMVYHFAGDTRFGTNFIMLGRLVEVRKDLEQAVLSSKWESWVERDARRVGTAAALCKALVMDDGFFAKAQRLLDLVR